ncbi:unnamed protein product [Orchesella dallaii]|uniref:Peptidase S1 domain-containing protein n=1 Tax=Orchesella dallaii TaxID=48710 RepID=A0ABP1PNG5_9HEXA
MVSVNILSFILIFGAICIQFSTQKKSLKAETEDFSELFFDARDETLTKELDLMQGTYRADERKKARPSIPSDVLDYKSNVDELECGELFRVKDEGYLTFKMDSPNEICKYQFIGTKTDNCTVAFMCTGKVKFKPPDESRGCVDEFIKISDGTDGRMAGCGPFVFDDKPRVARNEGTDVYFTFKGKADEATCVVFCIQDVKHDSPKLKKLKTISKIKNYKGRKTEPSCICGKKDVPQGRIVGGETSEKFEFPWIGAMLLKETKKRRLPFCGVSLINDRYAISAGHCFGLGLSADKIQLLFHAHIMDKKVGKGKNPDDKIYQEIPGWNDPKETDESENSIRIDVESVLVHPEFDIKTFEYDVALLKLKYKLNLSKDKVTPICLPEVSDNYNYTGKYFTVAGWGRYSESLVAGVRRLQKLDVPFHTLETCRKYNRATSRHVCGGYLQGGKDACSGDSGGPLMYKTDPMQNQYTLAGVVSAGRGCARKNALGLYTNLQGANG